MSFFKKIKEIFSPEEEMNQDLRNVFDKMSKATMPGGEKQHQELASSVSLISNGKLSMDQSFQLVSRNTARIFLKRSRGAGNEEIMNISKMILIDFPILTEQEAKEIVNMLLQIQLKEKKARDSVLDEEISIKSNNKILSSNEISGSDGRFGLDVTNPIPVKGITGIDNYFEYLSSTCGRTFKWDRQGSTSAENIDGMIDIYILTDVNGVKLPRLYICMYCDATSSKIPEGF